MNDKEKYEHGFSTPEDYFEEFENRLFSQLEGDLIPKETGFEVPDDYFESLEESILQSVSEEKTQKVIPLFNKRLLGYAGAIAACAVLAFGIFTKSETEEILQLADIEEYLLEENLSLDSYDIAQVLTDEDLETIDLGDEFFSEENIEGYLLENIEDTSLLIE